MGIYQLRRLTTLSAMLLFISTSLALSANENKNSGSVKNPFSNGNSAGITFTMVGNLNILWAMKEAEKHCQKYGKSAFLHQQHRLIASFRCVDE